MKRPPPGRATRKHGSRSAHGGTNTGQTLDLLHRFESRNVTFIEEDGSWPIVWERAKGVHVWDADRKRYVDLTAGFGVAAAGHANRAVASAGQHQMARLLHAMGDVHPHRLKAELARELSRITYERWTAGRTVGKTILCNSGFEAVEAALKTAALGTGRPGVIAFTGGYHGLGYGALNVTHRDYFRAAFRSQLAQFGHFVQFPGTETESPSPQPSPPRGRGNDPSVQDSSAKGKGTHTSSGVVRQRRSLSPLGERVGGRGNLPPPRGEGAVLASLASQIKGLWRSHSIGAILVEPVQGRGGIRIPPAGFLPLLRKLCDELKIVLVLDEIFTGFGRTGQWFACEHTRVVPDLICLGKALTGGFPLSACVGNAELMDRAWPASTGEAIHTSTFLGHPVGCAMALAQIQEISRLKLVSRSAELGEQLLRFLRESALPANLICEPRGLGLMAGIEINLPDGSPATSQVMRAIKLMLREGFILLPEGEHSNVISCTPPLTISQEDLFDCVKTLQRVLQQLAMRRDLCNKLSCVQKRPAGSPPSWGRGLG